MTNKPTTQRREATEVVSAGAAAVAEATQWDANEASLITKSVAPGLTVGEFKLFAKICEATNKNPFRKEIYAWKSGGKLAIHIAVQGLRVDAARTGEYVGQDGPYFCGPDGVWTDIWTSDKPPYAAKVGVKRRGFDNYLYHVALYKSFKRNTPNWKDQPEHMLALRAEYHALKRAFADAATDNLQKLEEVSRDVGLAYVVEDEEPEFAEPGQIEGPEDEDEGQARMLGDDVE